MSFWKAVVSNLDENGGDNPQHGDLEGSDLHHGGIYKQWNSLQTVEKGKCFFHLVLES